MSVTLDKPPPAGRVLKVYFRTRDVTLGHTTIEAGSTGPMRVTAVGVVTDMVVCTALVSVQPGTPTGDAVTLTTKPVAGHVALAALEQVTVTLLPEATEDRQRQQSDDNRSQMTADNGVM